MNDCELYDITPICEPRQFEKMKKKMSVWITDIINSREFKNIVDIKITKYHKILIIKCTLELLDVVYNSINRLISSSRFKTIVAACFIISVQLLYGFDNIYDGDLFSLMKSSNDSSEKDKSFLKRLVYDILEKTDWKGCNTFLLKTEHGKSSKIKKSSKK